MANVFSLDCINFDTLKSNGTIKKQERHAKEIAIIGISGKLAGCSSIEDFWNSLENGIDCIRDLPEKRKKDCESIRKVLLPSEKVTEYIQSGHMEEIDTFDYEMFQLSPKESMLMDPNQRLFLQTAYSAIDDAGYGNGKLCGSRTGVFIGYSGDFGEEYKRYIRRVSPKDIGLSISGNIKSVIASRISYVLDLKGPSMLVDTACSSSLTAVHLACQSLRNDECRVALTGSVKINILPLRQDENHGIGIESSDDRTRTFDEHSDGTGSGEGVVVLVLKKLSQALEDRDNIYAVIKGSAINQDGTSNGLTAPNSEAQMDAILRAWDDAGVHPETVSYIEAHGTGTKLGDPIEIRGIQKAFLQYTNKRQFCAIGSVKSNIGHLDHAAGIAGLAKVILSLKNKRIPPTLHFQRPNRSIDFINTAVYINDRLRDWDAIQGIRRCGISSFGLSGTNCHMILEESPVQISASQGERLQLFTLSAKSDSSLMEMVQSYHRFLQIDTGCSVQDVCFTQNTGRGHYSARLAMIVTSIEDIVSNLEVVLHNAVGNGNLPKNVGYGLHNLLPDNVTAEAPNDINLSKKRNLDSEAALLLASFDALQPEEILLEKILKLYISGADIQWALLYKGLTSNRVSLPPYSFSRMRCWINYQEVSENKECPLIDQCVLETPDQRVFIKQYSPSNDWILGQHLVEKKHVLPGTAFIETMSYIAIKYYGFDKYIIKNIVFSAPFIVDQDDTRQMQIVVRDEKGSLIFSFASRSSYDTNWTKHSEGTIVHSSNTDQKRIDVDDIVKKLKLQDILQFRRNQQGAIEVGDRWNSLERIYFGANEFLAYFKIAERFANDLQSYYLYPPVLDDCVNIANKSLNGSDYLPFSYKSIHVYERIPRKVYSHIKRINSSNNDEVIIFDIDIFDENGLMLAEITEYSVRKMSKKMFHDESKLFQQIKWIRFEGKPLLKRKEMNHCTLIFHNNTNRFNSILKELSPSCKDLIEIKIGEFYNRDCESSYTITGSLEDYQKLALDLSEKNISRIVHGLNVLDTTSVSSIEEFDMCQTSGVYSLYYMTCAFKDILSRNPVDIFLIADYAHKVNESQESINPHNASFFGLAKVLPFENTKITMKCIDIDYSTASYQIVDEILKYKMPKGVPFELIAYREGIRFSEQLDYVNIGVLEDRRLPVYKGGTYLITGGMGFLGLSIADYLAKKEVINIALLGRNALPPRKEWDVLLSKGTNDGVSKKVRMIKQIEEQGSNVKFYICDVSNILSMEKTVIKINKELGKINGVIHAAGVAGDGFLILKDQKTFKNVVDVKTRGTWILEYLLKSDQPDFIISFSSISSIVTQPGQGDYIAANKYLDSFAFSNNGTNTSRITINWAAWRDIGMAFEYGLDNVEGIYRSISTEAALAAFDKVIHKDISSVAIGEFNYDLLAKQKNRLSLGLSMEILRDMGAYGVVEKGKSQVHHGNDNSQIVILGKSMKQVTETELKLSHIWARVLGIDEILVYKSFSDMGGDSILAMRLLDEMEVEYPSVLNISDIFTYSNVIALAEYVDKKTGKENKIEQITSDKKLGNYLEMLANGEINTSSMRSLVDLEDRETWN